MQVKRDHVRNRITMEIIGMERKGLLRAVEIKGGIKWISGQEKKRRRWVTIADFQIPYL